MCCLPSVTVRVLLLWKIPLPSKLSQKEAFNWGLFIVLRFSLLPSKWEADRDWGHMHEIWMGLYQILCIYSMVSNLLFDGFYYCTGKWVSYGFFFTFFWDLFFCLPFLTLMCKLFKKNMLYYYSLVCFSLIRDRKGVDPNGRGWEEKQGTVEGSDTIIKI